MEVKERTSTWSSENFLGSSLKLCVANFYWRWFIIAKLSY